MLNYLFTKTPLFFLTQSFWRDEAFTYFLAKKNVFEIIFLTAKDFNPPLYYLVLHFWMKIFGGSEIALRSLSIIFFWATIYAVFFFLRDILKIKLKKSFFYLIFFIINPLLLYYAFEARMYSMFAFLATLSYYAFCKKNYRLYLLATIAGLFTHYFMILVILSQLLFLLINRKNGLNFKKSIIYLSSLVFSPWLIYVFLQKNSLSFWLTKPKLIDSLGILGAIYTGNEIPLHTKIQNNILYITLTLFVILITGIYLYFKKFIKKDQMFFQLIFIWAIGISLMIGIISLIKPIYLPRYLIFSTVGLILLTIFIAEKINVLARIFLLIILFSLTINYNQLQFSYRKKTDLRKVLREIKEISNKKDFVYVTNELDFFTAEYYLNENRVFIYGKSYQEIPDYVGKILIPEKKTVTNLPFYPQRAFILNSDGEYTIQAMY